MKDSAVLWLHWTLFGLMVLEVIVLAAVAVLRIHTAYVTGDLTRQTLYAALLYLGAMLAQLWIAGWVVASRPQPAPKTPNDAWYL
jgi:hypothetical protein